MTEVYLYGDIAEKYGNKFDIEESSVSGVMRAFFGNFPEFKFDIREGDWYIKRHVNDEIIDMDEDLLNFEMRNAPIHIYPVAYGSGRGVGKIIVGVLLIGIAIIAPYLAPGLTFIMGAHFFAGMALFGVSLALGGLAMLISPGPTTSKRTDSYLGSPTNVIAEGEAVPLVFGTIMCQSRPVVASMITNQIQVGNTNFRWTDTNGTDPIYVGSNNATYNPLYN